MEIKIEKLTYNGYGLGRLNGLVVFVPFSVPEDVLRIKITERKKDYAFGEIKEIVKPSPYRVNPKCENFTICGGCQWLNIMYEKQLIEKEKILERELLRNLKHCPEIRTVSAYPFHYRRRATFKVSNRLIGFYKFKSNTIVPIGNCVQITENMNKALLILHSFSHILKNVDEIWMGEDKDGSQLLIHIVARRKIREIHDIFHAIKEGVSARIGVRISYRGKRSTLGIDKIEENILNNTLYYTFGSFFQANRFLTEELVKIVADIAEKMKEGNTIELFSGLGTFSFPVARYSKSLICVETNKKALNILKEAAEKNGISNIKVVNEPAEKFIETFKEKVDLIVLDPPRTGAKEIMPHIERLKPQKIIYISCNPTTLSRDISLLKSYDIGKIHFVDMFPHTFHIETVTELDLKS